jgi:acyl carrier protein
MDDQGGIEQRVLALIAQALPGAAITSVITPATRLRSELGFDSLGLVSLVFILARLLGADVDELIDAMGDAYLRTAGDLVSLAGRALDARPAGAPGQLTTPAWGSGVLRKRLN